MLQKRQATIVSNIKGIIFMHVVIEFPMCRTIDEHYKCIDSIRTFLFLTLLEKIRWILKK